VSQHLQHDSEDDAPATFNVAVLGASAGGVNALSRLIARLPAKPEFATVVLTHLDPTQDSHLSEVLQKHTQLPVRPIAHGELLEHAHIYVLTAGILATLRDRCILTAPRPPGLNLPIDEFMTSAARDNDVRVAGAVLSGTGSDGTAGALEIKAVGGLVIAQDPESAAHEGMPRALIDDGIADEILAPELIGAALERFFSMPTQGAASTLEQHAADALALVQKQSGLDLRYYKDVNVRRRLLRRAFLQSRGDLAAYLKLLHEDANEVAVLQDDLLIGVTSFFRDLEFSTALEHHVFPELIGGNAEAIRIWIPACSTGEEAYSIAMLLHHMLQVAGISRKVQIFGSDVNELAIQRARSGRYDEAALAAVPEHLRSSYFINDGAGWRISKQIREMCVFAAHNVLTNAPFSNVDLVSARNLLIYLRKSAKRQAFEVFFYALRKGGHLLLGASENADPELFEESQPNLNLYRRRQITRPPIRGFSFAETSTTTAIGRGETPATSLESLADRLALARYAPPGFVVDANGQVVQFRGDTSPLLQPTIGDAALSLARLVRPELQVDVRAALMEAVRSKLPVRRERLRLGEQHCSLEVVPIPAGGSERYFLVSVQDCGPANSAPQVSVPPDGRTEDLERYVRVLGDELEQTRGQLKAVVTEYDTTGEELRTANEEILSANEELQSSNEELKEAKRDLESANVALTSLNQELQGRNAQLLSLNDDLSNLIRGIPVPVLMLDREQHIRHFSPAAGELFRLGEDSLGQPLGLYEVFAPNVLDTALGEALKELRPVEQEIQDLNGRWYVLWARAYQTSENRIEGAVLAFQDIHRLKLALETANNARAEAERANAAKNDFLALVSHELRSPLNIMSNWVQLLRVLRFDQGTDPRIAKGLETIDRSCKDQARLIDDLLDVSRITSGSLVLDLRPTDFAAVARSTIEGMTLIAERKGIAINASGFGDPLVLAGDMRRLQQILTNLLGNAIKFTPAGGHIDVTAARIDNSVELTVSDSGIGIAPEELPRIFNRFSQSDISKTRKYGGMGLGLSIVRNLVEAHGGKVAAASNGLGLGSSFVLRLPLAPTGLPSTSESISSFPAAGLSLQGLSILVVDDEAAGRDALAQMLVAVGAAVETAGGAAEALHLLQERRFDVLISDIAMPDFNGYELICKVRKLEVAAGRRHLFAIAVTGFSTISDRDEALAAGFDAHFGKPLDINDIVARMSSAARSI
jgi:two-component system CheB/CheR fusion protein